MFTLTLPRLGKLLFCACAVAAAAQSLQTYAQSAADTTPSAPAAAVSQPQAAAPRYTASILGMAFNYMNANRDGKVSRAEAAGFSGVAKHFDEADLNHDHFLSREEFDNAMNYVKPQ